MLAVLVLGFGELANLLLWERVLELILFSIVFIQINIIPVIIAANITK